jgi:general secretion pathway protein D
MMNEIRSIVKQLDVRRPQVLIEAAIVEITADKSQKLGIQLAGGNTAATFNGGTTQFSGAGLSIGDILTQLGNPNVADVSGEGLAVTLGTKAGFNVILQALASTTGANLLSTPSIITLDNEEAKIVVGQNVPFRTGSFSTQNAGVSNPFTTIERQDIGITLKVMPQIHEGNLVKMNIEQEVSSIAPTTVQTSGAADIVTNKRTIQTKVLAEDGETIVLGGLIEDDISEIDSKVPLLGDIPVLGSLFGSKSHSSTKKNLLVFLRPTVLRGSEQMAGVTQRGYGQVYDLMLGRKNLADVNDAGMPERILDAGSVFEMPPKKLPWLVGGGGGVSELPASDVPTTQSALDNQLLEPQPLPWLTTSSPAAPVTPVESGSQQSPAPVTLTPPQ